MPKDKSYSEVKTIIFNYLNYTQNDIIDYDFNYQLFVGERPQNNVEAWKLQVIAKESQKLKTIINSIIKRFNF